MGEKGGLKCRDEVEMGGLVMGERKEACDES